MDSLDTTVIEKVLGIRRKALDMNRSSGWINTIWEIVF